MAVQEAQFGLGGGNHICYAANPQASSTTFIEAFARRGVARKQRVVWLVDDHGEGTVAALAGRHGRGSDGAALNGSCIVARASDLYLHGGRFELDRMLERYDAYVAEALAEGYTGLRVLADTSFLARAPGEYERFVEYEHRVNELFAADTFAAVCVYDARGVPAAWLQAASSAHPLHAHPGSAAVTAGICRLTETAPGRVALSGEVDHSNAAPLRTVLTDMAAGHDVLHLDLSALGFSDVAGVRALAQVAEASAPALRLVVHHPPRSLRMVVDALSWAGKLELAGLGDGT